MQSHCVISETEFINVTGLWGSLGSGIRNDYIGCGVQDAKDSDGNAIDAALATKLALAVVYPNAGNIGGGGFMVAHLADGRNHLIYAASRATEARFGHASVEITLAIAGSERDLDAKRAAIAAHSDDTDSSTSRELHDLPKILLR